MQAARSTKMTTRPELRPPSFSAIKHGRATSPPIPPWWVPPSTCRRIHSPSRALRHPASSAIASLQTRPTSGCRWPPNRSTGDRSSMPQRGLVILQVALSVVLLAGAFLMTKSLRNLEHQDFGITTVNRYVPQFDPKGVGYTLGRLPALYREIEGRFSSLPGMANVS